MQAARGGTGRRSRAGAVRPALVVALVGLVSAPAGWYVTDVLERDDDFCNACHLEPGVPLHQQIRRDYDARPVRNLAGRHAAAGVLRDGEHTAFRCIDCHGGSSWTGRARTKLLAAKDAFWFVVGHFEEPREMAWPLWDEDCSQCHPHFDDSPERAAAAAVPPFHALAVHNAALGVACVACHDAHATGGSEELYYLHPAAVRRQCAGCHREFE